MAMASIAASAAGGTLGTVGSYYGALGEKSSLRFQATLADINAEASESQARYALERGEREEQSLRLETAQLKSEQRVGLAGNGVDLTSGTAAAILTSTDVLGEIDANQIKSNTLREAWGHRTEAVNYRSSARTSRATADSISPGVSAATTLLTSAGQVAGQYYQADNSGSLAKSQDRWSGVTKRSKSFLSGLQGF